MAIKDLEVEETVRVSGKITQIKTGTKRDGSPWILVYFYDGTWTASGFVPAPFHFQTGTEVTMTVKRKKDSYKEGRAFKQYSFTEIEEYQDPADPDSDNPEDRNLASGAQSPTKLNKNTPGLGDQLTLREINKWLQQIITWQAEHDKAHDEHDATMKKNHNELMSELKGAKL